MTSYEVGFAVHIIGVMIFSGGALLAGVVFERARRRRRPSEISLLLWLTRIGAFTVVAGAVLVLGAGLWLAGELDQYGEAWLLTSLGLFSPPSSSARSEVSGRSAPASWPRGWRRTATR